MQINRALIVSGSEKGLDIVTSFVKSCGYQSVNILSSGGEARRIVGQEEYNLIIINTPLKDEFGYQLSLQLSETTCSGIILICKVDIAGDMTNKTISYGVNVVPKPLNKNAFHQAILLGTAVYNRMMGVKKENKKLQMKLEELHYVSRAKCILIDKNKYTESQAHRYIEKNAMDTRRTRKEVAIEIISLYDID